jgi:dipeptidyl aminopeptidase/acylaminoacyl peptidase
MFHGQKDEVVPVSFSRKVLFLFTKAKKRMIVIKNGDHSLSQKKNLKKIFRELDSFRNSSF